jgi:hypothetical protein
VTPYKKFARGLPTTCGVFARWLSPITYKGGNLCGIPLKEIEFKVKKQEATEGYIERLSEVRLQIMRIPLLQNKIARN